MAKPETIAEIDAQIAEDRARMESIDSCQTGLRDYYVLDIERLTNLRRIVATGSPALDALQRMRLRAASAKYAAAAWAGDTAEATRLSAEIERLERGQS